MILLCLLSAGPSGLIPVRHQQSELWVSFPALFQASLRKSHLFRMNQSIAAGCDLLVTVLAEPLQFPFYC